MTASLYLTIWIALTLFVAAEAGRSRFADAGGPPAWTRPALGLGALLLVAHVLIALHVRYGWNHDIAVRETARQAAAVYGFEWRGNIFVSYVFVLLWCAEVVRWRNQLQAPGSRVLLWAWRGFSLIIIFNAAIVFATSFVTRVLGVLLVAVLAWAWWPAQHRKTPPPLVYNSFVR